MGNNYICVDEFQTFFFDYDNTPTSPLMDTFTPTGTGILYSKTTPWTNNTNEKW
jgi:hypothetical protein